MVPPPYSITEQDAKFPSILVNIQEAELLPDMTGTLWTGMLMLYHNQTKTKIMFLQERKKSMTKLAFICSVLLLCDFMRHIHSLSKPDHHMGIYTSVGP